jgi:hypothetical protein
MFYWHKLYKIVKCYVGIGRQYLIFLSMSPKLAGMCFVSFPRSFKSIVVFVIILLYICKKFSYITFCSTIYVQWCCYITVDSAAPAS